MEVEEGIRNSSLIALLENYGGTLNVFGCMRDVVEKATSVQMVFESHKLIVFSREDAAKEAFSGVFHNERVNVDQLPHCSGWCTTWHKQEDRSYVVSLGRFAITSWK